MKLKNLSIMTFSQIALHRRISIKGSNYSFPVGHKMRDRRTDSAYSGQALKSLIKIINAETEAAKILDVS